MILVTTAGKVGSEAARLLAERGVLVRIVVRNPEQAAPLATAGVDVFKANLEVPATIDAAMQGVSSVVVVTPPVVRQELNVIDGAVLAGVERVVKITTKASADSPIARRRNHAQIENALIASGLGDTLLRNNAYMQNFLMLAPASPRPAASAPRPATAASGISTRATPPPSPHRLPRHCPPTQERPAGRPAPRCSREPKVLGRTITFHPINFKEQAGHDQRRGYRNPSPRTTPERSS